jgi:hypothetical protein
MGMVVDDARGDGHDNDHQPDYASVDKVMMILIIKTGCLIT